MQSPRYFAHFCKYCGKSFYVQGIYCSEDCKIKHQKLATIKQPKRQPLPKPIILPASFRFTPKKGYAVSGTYRGIYCQSIYELAFVIWALDHKKSIARCKLQIPYFYKAKFHKYNPDFVMNEKIYELKGGPPEKSFSAKMAGCQQNNINITVIHRKELEFYVNYVRLCHKIDLLKNSQKFYDPKPFIFSTAKSP